VEGSNAENLQRRIDSMLARMGQAAFASAFERGQTLGTLAAAKLAVIPV